MDLTIDKAIEYHRELWGWLSENPKKEKWDWPGWNGLEYLNPGYHEHCFACIMSKDCDECLLVWPGTGCCNDDRNGLFMRWEQAKGKKRSALAIQIRDLPVREEPETWNPLEAWRDA